MLQRLIIEKFRNIDALSFNPESKFNLITGPNGSGKTAVLEAIYFLSHGRSFRTSRLARLIQEEQNHFSLFAEIFQKNVTYQIGLSRDLEANPKLKINGQNSNSHVAVTQRLPSLLINPELYSLFWQGSGLRRSILDWGLFYQDPEFLNLWQRADRVLKQRNAALKQINISDNLITLWDQDLILLSEKLDRARKNYFSELLNQMNFYLSDFLDAHSIQISYYRGWPQDQDLASCLKHHLAQDKHLGHTHYGPHRADLKIRIHQGNAQEILSRGQQKKLITSLRLAQGQILEKQTGHTCIYLLDDLASELDEKNKQDLVEQLIPLSSQVFITSLNPDLFDLPKSIHIPMSITLKKHR